MKHKQELAAIKQELTKLQHESRSGQKGKDVAAKELEATKKKLQDVEAKLKVAVTDKQAALQVSLQLQNPQPLYLPSLQTGCSIKWLLVLKQLCA